MNTWGISGPTFLVLYAALLALTAAIAWVAYRRLSGPGLDGVRPGSLELGPYEVAALNGGDRLAVAAAACMLREAGSLSPGRRSGQLSASGPPPSSPDPLESAIYYAVADGAGRSAAAVQREVGRGSVLAEIRDRLRQLELVPSARRAALLRLQALWFLPVLGLGVARLVAGSRNHRPVGYLVILLMIGAGLAIWTAARRPRRTRRGQAVLEALQRDGAAGRSGAPPPRSRSGSPFGDGHEPAGAVDGRRLAATVALAGAGSLWAEDAAFASALGIRREASGGGGFVGGVGCGGGGGGGGGCGG